MVNFQKLEMAFFEDRFDTTLYQIHLRSLRVVIFMYLLVFVVAVVSHLRLDLNIKINVNFVRDYVNFEKVTVTEFRYSFCFHFDIFEHYSSIIGQCKISAKYSYDTKAATKNKA